MTTVVASDWNPFRYRGTLVSCTDGDTAVIDIDLGFRVHYRATIRLVGFNAPELRGPSPDAGQQARQALTQILTGRTLYLRTLRDSMSFERYLAEVWLDDDGTFVRVADLMTSLGFHVPQGQ